MADAAEEAGVVPAEPGVPSNANAVSPRSEHSFASSLGSVMELEEAM